MVQQQRFHTHSKRSGWWSFWSGCWGMYSAPSRHSRQCACGGSLWWWTVAQCRPGSCCRTTHTDWPGWIVPDTVKKQSLAPGLNIPALSYCMESHQSEEYLGQLRREVTNTLRICCAHCWATSYYCVFKERQAAFILKHLGYFHIICVVCCNNSDCQTHKKICPTLQIMTLWEQRCASGAVFLATWWM